MEIILPLLGGLGIGGILTSLLQSWMQNNKDRKVLSFSEKREAYVGLLTALHDAAVNPSDRSSKGYALWQTRVSLVGSPEVVKYTQSIVDTVPSSGGRNVAFSNLVEAMRVDLGVDVRKINRNSQ